MMDHNDRDPIEAAAKAFHGFFPFPAAARSFFTMFASSSSSSS